MSPERSRASTNRPALRSLSRKAHVCTCESARGLPLAKKPGPQSPRAVAEHLLNPHRSASKLDGLGLSTPKPRSAKSQDRREVKQPHRLSRELSRPWRACGRREQSTRAPTAHTRCLQSVSSAGETTGCRPVSVATRTISCAGTAVQGQVHTQTGTQVPLRAAAT